MAKVMATAKYDEGEYPFPGMERTHRTRPGMYIGKLGDGQNPDDGIYVLKGNHRQLHDEFRDGRGQENRHRHRGRLRPVLLTTAPRHPLGKVVDCVSKMNTGGKYD